MKYQSLLMETFFIILENKTNENLMVNPKKNVPIPLKTKFYFH